MKTREDAKKREFSRVAQGSASGAKWRKEAKGATPANRKLEQKCGVTHFAARGAKEPQEPWRGLAGVALGSFGIGRCGERP